MLSLVVTYWAPGGGGSRPAPATATREHGIDIEADRDGENLLVEVKGFPASTFSRGERAGQTRTQSGAQARAYFGGAVLTGLLMRAEHEGATVVLAFPDLVTYRNLARRVGPVLDAAHIAIWLVTEQGDVIANPSAHTNHETEGEEWVWGVVDAGAIILPASAVEDLRRRRAVLQARTYGELRTLLVASGEEELLEDLDLQDNDEVDPIEILGGGFVGDPGTAMLDAFSFLDDLPGETSDARAAPRAVLSPSEAEAVLQLLADTGRSCRRDDDLLRSL